MPYLHNSKKEWVDSRLFSSSNYWISYWLWVWTCSKQSIDPTFWFVGYGCTGVMLKAVKRTDINNMTKIRNRRRNRRDLLLCWRKLPFTVTKRCTPRAILIFGVRHWLWWCDVRFPEAPSRKTQSSRTRTAVFAMTWWCDDESFPANQNFHTGLYYHPFWIIVTPTSSVSVQRRISHPWTPHYVVTDYGRRKGCLPDTQGACHPRSGRSDKREIQRCQRAGNPSRYRRRSSFISPDPSNNRE